MEEVISTGWLVYQGRAGVASKMPGLYPLLSGKNGVRIPAGIPLETADSRKRGGKTVAYGEHVLHSPCREESSCTWFLAGPADFQMGQARDSGSVWLFLSHWAHASQISSTFSEMCSTLSPFTL